MRHRVSILAFALAGAASASAQTQQGFADVSLTVGSPLAPHMSFGAGAIEYDHTLDNDGGSAYGYADLSSGILRGTTAAAAAGLALSTSAFADYVTFNAGATGTAYLDFHWDGTVSPFNNPNYAEATLGMVIGYGDGSVPVAQYNILTNGSCFGVTGNCVSGTSIDQTVAFGFAIRPGPTLISVYLLLDTYGGQTADFSNTANFYLTTPSGVTYTSGTGQFLSTAAPIALVPEPATWALMLGGLCALGSMARRQREQMRSRLP